MYIFAQLNYTPIDINNLYPMPDDYTYKVSSTGFDTREEAQAAREKHIADFGQHTAPYLAVYSDAWLGQEEEYFVQMYEQLLKSAKKALDAR